jgi:CheY-like chemotaxis protein
MRVLIVEDETIIAMHLRMLVEELGHQVCATANSVAQAIERTAALRPDVVLMDIYLARGTSGVDAVRELHERLGLRCIVLSANVDEPTKTALLPYEPIAFVGKPVLPVLLQRALKKAEEGLTQL